MLYLGYAMTYNIDPPHMYMYVYTHAVIYIDDNWYTDD